MDSGRFDTWTMTFSARHISRRLTLGGVVVGALGALVGPASVRAACLPNGQKCKHDTSCCSGACAGRKHRKKCKAAPNRGTCTTKDPSCGVTYTTVCRVGSDSSDDCRCYVTTSGRSFCGSTLGGCFGCADDAACEEALQLSGSTCIDCPTSFCADHKLCVAPCPPCANSGQPCGNGVTCCKASDTCGDASVCCGISGVAPCGRATGGASCCSGACDFTKEVCA